MITKSLLQIRFERHIKNKFSFTIGQKILIACSGGIDSVALVNLLKQSGAQIAIAHFNYKLRSEESNEDALFVQNLATQNSILFFSNECDLSKTKDNIQMLARKLRYEWFEEICQQFNFQYIATAHHADDSIETTLQNLIKGTGIDGLTGIPSQRGNIIRPLLPFFKDELREYAQHLKLEYREDSSNATTKYSRNKIRHLLIPLLENLNPKVKKNILTTIQNLSDYSIWSTSYLESWKQENISYHTDYHTIDLERLPQIQRIFATQLYELLQPYLVNKEISSSISKAYFKDKSGVIWYSGDYELLYSRKKLWIQHLSEKKKYQISYSIEDSKGVLTLPYFSLSWNSSLEIKDKNFTIRTWRAGDYIHLKDVGKKKLQDYFSNQKFSLFQKERTWLLAQDNEVLWIINERKSERLRNFHYIDFQVHTI